MPGASIQMTPHWPFYPSMIKQAKKAIEKGNLFDAELDISLLGHDFNWTIDFNVKDVSNFIDSVFKKALKELKAWSARMFLSAKNKILGLRWASLFRFHLA